MSAITTWTQSLRLPHCVRPSGSLRLAVSRWSTVAAVAEAAQSVAFFRRITFKIGAGQIVKQDFVFCLEEVAPASGEVVEEGAFMGQEFVVAGVEAVGIGQGEVAAQQVGDGAVVKPMPVARVRTPASRPPTGGGGAGTWLRAGG